jgi:hypothetical protein
MRHCVAAPSSMSELSASHSIARRRARESRMGWRQRLGGTARGGHGISSTSGSGEDATTEPTGTSGSKDCPGCVRHCTLPGDRRWCGCWPPARGWLDDELRTWTATARTEIRRPQLEKLSSPLTRLLKAADDTLREEITAALRGYGNTVLECLMPALRSAARRTAGFDEIARDCARRLTAILARPRREADDWSIAWAGCRCELCDTLAGFLGSRSRRTFEWPLAKDGRRHVHTQIDSAGLPVRHQTRRQGRPDTLVLTKTDELFTRARTAWHTAEIDLAWLTATWDDVPART